MRKSFIYFFSVACSTAAVTAAADFTYNESASAEASPTCASERQHFSGQNDIESFRAWASCERNQKIMNLAREAIARVPIPVQIYNPQTRRITYNGTTTCEPKRLETFNFRNNDDTSTESNPLDISARNNSGSPYTTNKVVSFQCVTNPTSDSDHSRWLAKFQMKVNNDCFYENWSGFTQNLFANGNELYANNGTAQARINILLKAMNSPDIRESFCGRDVPLCNLNEDDSVRNIQAVTANAPLVRMNRSAVPALFKPSAAACLVPSQLSPDGNYALYPFAINRIDPKVYCANPNSDLDAILGENYCRHDANKEAGPKANEQQRQGQGKGWFSQKDKASDRTPASARENLIPIKVR